jgi:hypothetical protein
VEQSEISDLPGITLNSYSSPSVKLGTVAFGTVPDTSAAFVHCPNFGFFSMMYELIGDPVSNA